LISRNNEIFPPAGSFTRFYVIYHLVIWPIFLI